MVDKRFWSGAIIVATTVVAGASSLPTLLLQPAVPEAAPAVATAPQAAEPVVQRPAEPVVLRPEPTAAPLGAVAPLQPTKAAVAPELPRPAQPVTFPPVQPIDLAAPRAPAPSPNETRPASAPIAPAAQARPARVATQPDGKRNHPVRPAAYPIREFLAWHR